jgi:hypothetical protein
MKRVVLASFFAVLFIGAIALGYFYYYQLKTPTSEAISAIPSDAAFIVETRNPKKAWQTLRDSEIWRDLKSSSYFSNLNRKAFFIDSVMMHSEKLSAVYESEPVFISAHLTKVHDFDFLFLVNLPKIRQETFVNDAIDAFTGGRHRVSKRNYDGITIREFEYPAGSKQVFTYAVTKGIFIAGFTPFLVEDAIRQLHIGKPLTDDPVFMKVYESSGKKVDANLFLNYANLPGIISPFMRPEYSSRTQSISRLADWSGLDIQFQKKSLMLNGFTSVANENSFLACFRDIKPGEMNAPKILPKNTVFFYGFRNSGFASFHARYKAYLKTSKSDKERLQSVARLNAEHGSNIESLLTGWMGEESVIAFSEKTTDGKNEMFALFSMKEKQLADSLLNELTQKNSAKQGKKKKSRDDKEPSIRRIQIPDLLGVFLGSAFEGMESTWYTIIGNYVVFAGSSGALRDFIDDYEKKKVLAHDASYRAVSEKLSLRSNCMFYVSMADALPLVKNIASDAFYAKLLSGAEGFKKLNAFAGQFSYSKNNLFYNNFVLLQSSGGRDVHQIWSVKLDTTMVMQPVSVINHKNDTREIIVQDQANNVYLIDNGGEVLWKKKLEEPVMGTIHQVDYYKNGKLQYLFNTRSRMHILDRNGDYVEDYPMKLSSEATAGLSVFDYEGKRDYRIFIPCMNKKILVFKINGEPFDGWGFNVSSAVVNQSVQHFVSGEKHYIVFTDTKGKTYFLDKRGNVRFMADENIEIATNARWSLKKDDKQLFVVMDKSGKMIEVATDGKTTISSFDEMDNLKEPFSYAMADLNSDGKIDYVFLEQDRLYIFNDRKEVVSTYAFDSDITMPLQLFRHKKKVFVGVTSDKTNEIFLFNNKGSLVQGYPLKGNTPFIITEEGKGGKQVIISGSSDAAVSAYSVSK